MFYKETATMLEGDVPCEADAVKSYIIFEIGRELWNNIHIWKKMKDQRKEQNGIVKR